MSDHFRETHLLAFLGQFDREKKPLDRCWSEYLKAHQSIGAHDRRFLSDTIYALIRWRGLLDYLIPKSNWESRYNLWRHLDLNALSENVPLEISCGGSPWLFQELARTLGPIQSAKLCRILNDPAPLTVRVNLLKTNRDELLNHWNDHYDVAPGVRSNTAIHFRTRVALTALPEFKRGLFEIQDEGSQLIAQLVQPKMGEQVLDYCSGSGGKSLAIAPIMSGRGQMYLHDIRPLILQEARKRLRRAGVQNAQFLTPDHSRLSSLKNKMDWVLVDVPCSGSGTFRRNPDMKWKLNEETLSRIIGEQRQIFSRALQFVRPGGHIVYATCSLFDRENAEQVEYFLKTFDLALIEPPLSIVPEPNGPDGFFGAHFIKKF